MKREYQLGKNSSIIKQQIFKITNSDVPVYAFLWLLSNFRIDIRKRPLKVVLIIYFAPGKILNDFYQLYPAHGTLLPLHPHNA